MHPLQGNTLEDPAAGGAASSSSPGAAGSAEASKAQWKLKRLKRQAERDTDRKAGVFKKRQCNDFDIILLRYLRISQLRPHPARAMSS